VRLFQVSSTSSPRPGRSKVNTTAPNSLSSRRGRAPRALHVAAVDGFSAESADHCTIGRNEGRIRSQAQAFEQRHGVVGAPAGGDGDGDSRLLRRPERRACAR
jgi:hypothetical protein